MSTGFDWQPAGAFVLMDNGACVWQRQCCELCEWEGWCRCRRCHCQSVGGVGIGVDGVAVTTATAAVGGGISVDGAGVNDAGIVVVVGAAVVIAVTGDDGVGGVEGAGGGIVVVTAAVSPRLQREPSLHHRMAKPRMGSRCQHERGRECWVD